MQCQRSLGTRGPEKCGLAGGLSTCRVSLCALLRSQPSLPQQYHPARILVLATVETVPGRTLRQPVIQSAIHPSIHSRHSNRPETLPSTSRALHRTCRTIISAWNTILTLTMPPVLWDAKIWVAFKRTRYCDRDDSKRSLCYHNGITHHPDHLRLSPSAGAYNARRALRRAKRRHRPVRRRATPLRRRATSPRRRRQSRTAILPCLTYTSASPESA